MPQPLPEHKSARLRSVRAVVGIGASAGGLEAETQLMQAWPSDAGIAFILVQHSDPTAGNMMAALLAPHTALTVLEAAERMTVEPEHLYIRPPGRYLSIGAGVLHLSTRPVQRGARMPFVFFFTR